ncbi:Ubiquitin-like-specific protease 1 [Cytospora mali]|uniref:Ubiquitin-like-specific protease 1 n=1 Tax=Cytospora mali TaxID=578113 RepID=A0A194WCV1_CYTMA|nr:Ubiquitin-like-specific protease 1 [Valsa mali]
MPPSSSPAPRATANTTTTMVGSDMLHSEELTLEEKIALLQRPSGSVRPADRVLDENYKLSADEIADIKPGKWLNDKVVQTVFRRLSLLRPGKFYAIDVTSISTMVEILEELLEEARVEFTRPVITDVAMLMSTRGTVLIPFNVDRSHFILVVVRLEERAIYIYDSMARATANNNYDVDYWHRLQEFAKKRVEWLLNFEPREVSVIRPELRVAPCPQQLNDVDCGVSICLTAMHLISHPENPWTFQRPQFSGEALWSTGTYAMRETYWLAGRKMILELCRPYANVSDEKVKESLDDTEAAIETAFVHLTEAFGRRRREEEHYDAISQVISSAGGGSVDQDLLRNLHMVAPLVNNVRRSRYVFAACMRCVNSDLVHILNYIRELGTASTVERDLAIQRQAPEVTRLSEAWEVFRPEVVRKAVTYAWHDVEEIKKVRDDLARATTTLLRFTQELYLGPGADLPSLESVMESHR